MTIRLAHVYETPVQRASNAGRMDDLLAANDFMGLLDGTEATEVEYLVAEDGTITSGGEASVAPNARMLNREHEWTEAHNAILARAGLVGCGWECGFPTEVKRLGA